MSVGPLLSVEHFQKFMDSIRRLGARVEEEQSRHLAEVKRLEESTGGGGSGRASSNGLSIGLSGNDETDFESLVRGAAVPNGEARIAQDLWGTPNESPSSSQVSWSQEEMSSTHPRHAC
jgi:SCY1-like protein 2